MPSTPPVIAYDPHDPCLRDQELATAADREWAALHGDVPGIWRIRRRVGQEGPPERHQSAFDLACDWILVVIIGPKIRLRHFSFTAEDARRTANAKGLNPKAER
jgi:hypothetical protein